MGNTTNETNWAARERLRRVEFLLWWRGWVGRGDLTEGFGISQAQASGDLQRYVDLNPQAMIYQPRRKRYEAAAKMRCVLHEPRVEDAIAGLLGGVPPLGGMPAGDGRFEVVSLPQRSCDPMVARRVMISLLEKRWIRVKYASLRSGKHAWRRLVPGRFAWDGQRWHVRAWCGENEDWRDFVIGRMSGAEWPGEDAGNLPPDEDWETMTTLRLQLNPKLSKEKRDALRMDYGLSGDVMELRVRKAMERYVLAMYFIDESHRELPRHFVIGK